MNSDYLFSRKNVAAIIIFGILAMIIGLAISLVQTPRYDSSAKLLVVVNQENVDPYTASRTADYISNILNEVVYSNSFIENVFKSNFDTRDTLGVGSEKRLKNWRKMVSIQTKENKGLIFIDVLHSDRGQAQQFAQAISYTLMTKHQLYHGLGDRILIKIIDSPVTSSQPVEPRTATNGLLGLLAGLVLGFTFIIIFPDQQLFSIFQPKVGKFRDETINLADSDTPEAGLPSSFDFANTGNDLARSQPEPATELIAEDYRDESDQKSGNYYDW